VRPGLIRDGEEVYRGYRVKRLQAAFDRYLPPVEQNPEDRDDDPAPNSHDAGVGADAPAKTHDQGVTSLQTEELCGSQGNFGLLPTSPGNGSKITENSNVSTIGNGVTGENPIFEGSAAHASSGASNAPGVSAVSDDQGATPVSASGTPTATPNGATDGFAFASVEEGARHFMTVHPQWSLSRLAKELAVPLSRIEELFPDRSPLVAKVRSVLAGHPDWTAGQIAKSVKRPRSAVDRALRVIGQ
jgi:hypothetical protein